VNRFHVYHMRLLLLMLLFYELVINHDERSRTTIVCSEVYIVIFNDSCFLNR
jgi:hypothetical protein